MPFPPAKPLLALLFAPLVGCAFESTATANRVPVPVLVGPVEQIGGSPRDSADEEAASFDVKVDRTLTASSSSQTSGNVTVTTTSVSASAAGAGIVDAKVRAAANGSKNRLVHVDQLRVNSYSGFFYSAAWLSSRVRIKGHVGRAVTIPKPGDAPAPAPTEPAVAAAPPAPSTPTAVAPAPAATPTPF